MKKIKVSLSLMAVVIAVAASAFTTPKISGQVYYFTGSASDIFNPDFYVSEEPEGLCQEGAAVPCSIQIPAGYTDKTDFLSDASSNPTLMNSATLSKRAE